MPQCVSHIDTCRQRPLLWEHNLLGCLYCSHHGTAHQQQNPAWGTDCNFLWVLHITSLMIFMHWLTRNPPCSMDQSNGSDSSKENKTLMETGTKWRTSRTNPDNYYPSTRKKWCRCSPTIKKGTMVAVIQYWPVGPTSPQRITLIYSKTNTQQW